MLRRGGARMQCFAHRHRPAPRCSPSQDLFLLLARAYGDAGDGAAAQAFLIRYLATFEGPAATPAALAAAAPHARAAALGYIRAPALSQRSSLAHLAAVRLRARSAPRAARASLLPRDVRT